MKFARMKIEEESPEEYGYDRIKYNLTESSTTDKSLADLGVKIGDDLLLCYGDHLGKPELRALIAGNYGAAPENVMVTAGACMALFIVYAALLEPGDHVVVMHPNYPANIEVPRSLGCEVDLYRLTFGDGFKLDADRLISMLKPRTKLVNVTYPHNPTGAMSGADDIAKLMRACEANGTYLMVDETYGDLTRGERLPHVTNMSPWGICVESLSKAIGAPGVRAGWIVSRNAEIFGRLLAAKEQVCICGSILDEECAAQILARREAIMKDVRRDIDEKFEIVCGLMDAQDVVEWIRPEGGVVCFPRIRRDLEVDTEAFYKILNDKYGVFVGPGRWFEMDDRYFRVGYAWPGKEELRQGLLHLFDAVRETAKG